MNVRPEWFRYRKIVMSDLVETGSKYTDEDRRRVVIEYHIKGNDQAVADATNISRQTINTWWLLVQRFFQN